MSLGNFTPEFPGTAALHDFWNGFCYYLLQISNGQPLFLRETENMKTGMRIIIYSATLLGWAQPGLAADCLFHNELTQANSLAYYFTLGIMLTLLAVIFGLKLLHKNKLQALDASRQSNALLNADACGHLKIGQNFSKWTHVQKMDEAKPTGA